MIVGDMERKHNINLLLLSVLLLVTAACSTTRNLPEDETLYVGVKNMEILNEDKTPAGVQTLEEVEAALSYPPNNAILGSNSLRFPIPFGLWIYNDFVKYQDKKGVGHWIFNKLGGCSGVFVYSEPGNPCEGGDQSVARLWLFQWCCDLFCRLVEESSESQVKL